ncbi:MAG: TIM-barrel domain-containing protein, partial [Terriglobales bacterium]
MKILRKCALLCFLIAPASVVVAQTPQQLGPVTFVKALPHGMELSAGNAVIRIVAVSDSVIRVRFAPEGKFPAEHSWSVMPEALKSPVSVRVLDAEDKVEFATAKVMVRVEKTTSRIVFLDKAGSMILEDARHRLVTWGEFGFRIWKTMPEDEHYYGLGEKGGPLDRRNQAFTNWNTDNFGWQESTDPLYKTIPFFLGMRQGRAYGLYLDNAWRSSFDFGKESRDAYSFGAEGGELDYYFIYGPHPKEVIRDYTALVGRMPLPPLWTLGYQQCRYSYHPEARVREVARTFREKKIPADVIYL